jgi:hypothetical protein
VPIQEPQIFKIGFTETAPDDYPSLKVRSRLKACQTGNPNEIYIAAEWPFLDKEDEEILHRVFAPAVVTSTRKTEWFKTHYLRRLAAEESTLNTKAKFWYFVGYELPVLGTGFVLDEHCMEMSWKYARRRWRQISEVDEIVLAACTLARTAQEIGVDQFSEIVDLAEQILSSENRLSLSQEIARGPRSSDFDWCLEEMLSEIELLAVAEQESSQGK